MRALMDLVLPRACAGCGAREYACCPSCAMVLACARPGPAVPQPAPAGMPWTWAGAAYGPVVRSVIVAWKDQDRTDLLVVLAPLLARTVRSAVAASPRWSRLVASPGSALAVPAPSRRTGTRRRGRYPVADLARAVLGADGRPPALTCAGALRFVRPVRDQAGLRGFERGQNLTGSMGVVPRWRQALVGAPVLLVDDVVTTGSTLVEAARVLREQGCGPLLAVTLAATERSAGPRAR